MQFKRVGRRIQVLAYRGYDHDKKRAIVKMLGSLSDYSLIPTDGLMDSLTADEKTELQSYIDGERSRMKSQEDSRSAPSAVWSIGRVTKAMAGGVEISPSDADALWAAMTELAKALRKSGHPRPAREVRPAAPDPAQGSLLAQADPQDDQVESEAPAADVIEVPVFLAPKS